MNHLIKTIAPWVKVAAAGQALDSTDDQISEVIETIVDSYHELVLTLKPANFKPFYRNQQRLLGKYISSLPGVTLRQELIRVWEHLHEYFPEYLDAKVPVPAVLLEQERQHHAAWLIPLKKIWKKERVDPELIALLEDSFLLRKLPDGEKVPYRKLAYLRDLATHIEATSHPAKDSAPMQERLFRLLILKNLNNHAFYLWATRQMDARIDISSPLAEQIRQCRALYLDFQQLAWQQDQVYISGLRPIHRDISSHFEARLAELHETLAGTNDLKQHGLLPIHVETILSATQLALVSRLFREEKVFFVKHPKRYFEFICNHFGSKQTKQLSPVVFANNHYGPVSDHDAKTIHHLFMQLAGAVKERYAFAG